MALPDTTPHLQNGAWKRVDNMNKLEFGKEGSVDKFNSKKQTKSMRVGLTYT